MFKNPCCLICQKEIISYEALPCDLAEYSPREYAGFITQSLKDDFTIFQDNGNWGSTILDGRIWTIVFHDKCLKERFDLGIIHDGKDD